MEATQEKPVITVGPVLDNLSFDLDDGHHAVRLIFRGTAPENGIPIGRMLETTFKKRENDLDGRPEKGWMAHAKALLAARDGKSPTSGSPRPPGRSTRSTETKRTSTRNRRSTTNSWSGLFRASCPGLL